MMRRKITIVGAGATGATAAHILAARDYADVVLTDIKEGVPQGKALDLNQMGPVLGFEPQITGTNGYEETAGSDVVVITAGLPRSPGMSRDDLVTTNEKIVGSVTEQIVAQSPDCTIVVLSNPLDAMCHVARNVSGFPKERVFGQAGILDTARFRTFIAWETGASVRDVQALVLGGHGDQMVPVVSAATVGGVPLRELVSEERIQQMVERTAKGGGEIVQLLGTSAWYAPGAAVAEMVDAILLDQKRVLPCTALLEGEYGIDGLYIGVPVKLGAGGIEEGVELELSDDERETIENRFPGRDYLVELGAPEFTSICPLTDAPDFGELTIRYVPEGKLFELKSLRDYLTSFRERKIFQEEVVNEVLEQLVADGAPRFVEVEGEFAARGGMTTRVVASSGELPQSWISD